MALSISRRARLAPCAALLAFLPALPAVAAESSYRLRVEDSALRFTYAEDGEPQNGGFDRFDATGRFDPEDLSKARLTLTISTESVSLPDAFREGFVQGSDWFDVKSHPDAVYDLDGLIKLSGDLYVAVGTLTIKGVEKRISAPVRLTFENGRAHARGDITFDRRDFNVGGGPASLFVEVGEKISVAFDLTAEPVAN
ncbi:MAG: YceI family protein [Pseudomonadota bacterium]